MPFALATLLLAQLAGELLRAVFHLPLPGPVIGMFLLAVWLVTGGRSWLPAETDEAPAPLTQVSGTLIRYMGLLFVPAGVGVMAQWPLLRTQWLPILMGLVLSTVLGLIVTALVMHHVTHRMERRAAARLPAHNGDSP